MVTKRDWQEHLPWSLFKQDLAQPVKHIWIQSAKDSGTGPNGRWAVPERRHLIPFGRGKNFDPLCHCLLDLMERDLGGHADHYAPYPFTWVIKQPDSDSCHIFGGNVFASGDMTSTSSSGKVTRGIGIQIQLPNFHHLCRDFLLQFDKQSHVL